MIFDNLIISDRALARRNAAAGRRTPSKEALPSDVASGATYGQAALCGAVPSGICTKE